MSDQNCRVQVFESKSGEFIRSFGALSAPPATARSTSPPAGLCVDLLLNGQIAVVDQMNELCVSDRIKKQFYEIIDAVINNQNFDKKLFEIQRNITNNRFNKIIDYLNHKFGDDLSITKEFIDLYNNTITL